MPASTYACALPSLDGVLVEVEADIGRSLPSFQIVGLPDSAVQEARERVRTAIRNSSLRFPTTRVTVNLAPGDLPKIGPSYDLAMAVAILAASEDITVATELLERTLFVGELALDGGLRPVSGALTAALLAKREGFQSIIVPVENASEAALVEGITVLTAATLSEVARYLIGEITLPTTPVTEVNTVQINSPLDFSLVRGQAIAKRALEIASAGGHNVRFIGPPGSGKTLLARSMVTILPPLSRAEVLEVTAIHSAAGTLRGKPYIAERPFRSPHHSTSHVALVGGGTHPKPGEVSLAHRGVLFLDEFPEFPRHVLESLRQPLEDGAVTVARAAGSAMFPARFSLVTAENPCPCGYRDDPHRACTCSAGELIRYSRRLSGPLLDRIDVHVVVPRLEPDELSKSSLAEPSAAVRERVLKARARQADRFATTHAITNADMSSREVETLSNLHQSARAVIDMAATKLHLSARSYFRILKLARTIADLDESEKVTRQHVAEALQFRSQDATP